MLAARLPAMAGEAASSKTDEATLRRIADSAARAGQHSSSGVGALLEQLGNVPWPVPGTKAGDLAAAALLALLQHIPLSQGVLVAQYCQVAATMMVKQQLHVGSDELERFVAFFLSVIQNSSDPGSPCPPVLQLDALRALGFLLFENGARVASYHARLLEILSPLIAGSTIPSGTLDRELLIAAVTCLGNMCARAGSKLAPRVNDIFALLLSKLRQCDAGVRDDASLYKLTGATLRALHYVVLEGKGVHAASVPSLFSILHRLCFLGGAAGVPVGSTSGVPSVLDAATAEARGLHTGASSDSDLGGATSGGSRGVAGTRSQHGKVRQYALLCLQSMARVNAKHLYPYWPQLLPTTTAASVAGASNVDPDLCMLLARDASPKVRSAAAGTVAAMLDGSRAYLAAASDADARDSFSSLSSTLAVIVYQVHARLLDAAERETAVQPLTQVLKSLEALMLNVSYTHLRPGLLSDAVARVRARALASDTPHVVRVASLACLAAAFASTPDDPRGELAPLVAWPSEEDQRAHDPDSPAGMLAQLWHLAGAAKQDTDVTAEVLHVMARQAGACPGAMRHVFLPHLAEPLLQLLASADAPVVRQAVVRVLDELLRPRTNNASGEGEDEDPAGPEHANQRRASSAAQHTDGHAGGLESAVKDAAEDAMWATLLEPLCAALGDPSIPVRASLCTVLSHIPASVFSRLREPSRIACVAAVLGAAEDAAHQVRSAACRTLGVYALFPALVREDPLFLDNTAAVVCRCVKDPQLSVRIRACWSLGNVCDALGVAMQHDPTSVQQLGLMKRLADVAIDAGKDNDKVRCNAVRALGNVAGMAPAAFLDDDDGVTLHRIIDVVIEHVRAGGVKVRWNAAVALGNAIRNPDLDLAGRRSGLQEKLFRALLDTVQDRRNFKMRIHATRALLSVRSREAFGASFLLVWDMVLHELAHIDEVDDFKDFRYKEHLRVELLRLLLQLLAYSRRRDFAELKHLLIEQAQFLYTTLDTLPGPFTEADTVKAMVAATELYEAHLKTIPVTLLTQYQHRAFGRPSSSAGTR